MFFGPDYKLRVPSCILRHTLVSAMLLARPFKLMASVVSIVESRQILWKLLPPCLLVGWLMRTRKEFSGWNELQDRLRCCFFEFTASPLFCPFQPYGKTEGSLHCLSLKHLLLRHLFCLRHFFYLEYSPNAKIPTKAIAVRMAQLFHLDGVSQYFFTSLPQFSHKFSSRTYLAVICLCVFYYPLPGSIPWTRFIFTIVVLILR